MKLAEGLHVFPWTEPTVNNCNAYYLDAGPGALVDPGHSQLYGHVEMALASERLPEVPALVILTHCHPDHLEAAVRLQRLGSRVAMHPADVRYLQTEGRELAASLGVSFPEITVDIFLEEGELKLGQESIQVLHTPGHSPGHICLHWPERKALIAGDLVFVQGVGRVDFPGGSGDQLKESVRRVAQLDLQWVLPGHGPLLKGPENIRRNFEFIEQYYFPMI